MHRACCSKCLMRSKDYAWLACSFSGRNMLRTSYSSAWLSVSSRCCSSCEVTHRTSGFYCLAKFCKHLRQEKIRPLMLINDRMINSKRNIWDFSICSNRLWSLSSSLMHSFGVVCARRRTSGSQGVVHQERKEENECSKSLWTLHFLSLLLRGAPASQRFDSITREWAFAWIQSNHRGICPSFAVTILIKSRYNERS